MFFSHSATIERKKSTFTKQTGFFGMYISAKSASRWCDTPQCCQHSMHYSHGILPLTAHQVSLGRLIGMFGLQTLLRIRSVQVCGKTQAVIYGKSSAIITCSNLAAVEMRRGKNARQTLMARFMCDVERKHHSPSSNVGQQFADFLLRAQS